jgi:dihydroflavonol-4-reductase
MAAVTDEPDDRKILTEADWNERSSLTRNPYYFSKTLAERAAWAFMKDASRPWDLVVINPFLVMGPSMTKGLNTSNSLLANLLNGIFPGILSMTWGIVDVRDVADAHVRAIASSAANGRYLCAAGTISMRGIVELLRAHGYSSFRLPSLSLDHPIGNQLAWMGSFLQPKGAGQYLRTHIGRVPRFDASKIQRDLDVRFRPIDQTILDTAADLVHWGHVPRHLR